MEIFTQATLFHESIIRPLFHNFKSLNEFDFGTGKKLWAAYHEVNQLFANTIIQNMQFWDESCQKKNNSELIWIHNSNLLLLPTLLRRKHNHINIGFSLHSPWPSTDVFKMFRYRVEVLKSLMCCDLISFHMFEYARNFYTAVTRMLDVRQQFR